MNPLSLIDGLTQTIYTYVHPIRDWYDHCPFFFCLPSIPQSVSPTDVWTRPIGPSNKSENKLQGPRYVSSSLTVIFYEIYRQFVSVHGP